jgi:hypothetical protein
MKKMDRSISERFIKQISIERYPIAEQNPISEISQSQFEKILDITDGMPLAMKLFVSQIDLLDLDDALENLKTVAEERELYDYLFESSWQELKRQQAKVSMFLLVHLATIKEPISTKELYGIGGYSKRDIISAFEKLRKLSLIDFNSSNLQTKQIYLHSFTIRYVNETLQRRYG